MSVIEDYNQLLVEKEAEIEKLREELSRGTKQMTADTMSKDESIRLMQAEIERLRKDVDHWREARRSCIEAGDMMKEEIDRLREEATQLRQAVGMLTTLHPTMEIDVNNPVQMAQEIVSYVTESKDAEIERLRELLREAHLALSFMPDPTRKLLDLRYRVREALGDVSDA